MGGRFVDFLLLRFGLARAPPFCGALAGYQRPCADFHDDGAEAKRAQLVKEGRADVVTLAKAADAIRIDVAITALILGRPAGAMRTLALLGGQRRLRHCRHTCRGCALQRGDRSGGSIRPRLFSSVSIEIWGADRHAPNGILGSYFARGLNTFSPSRTLAPRIGADGVGADWWLENAARCRQHEPDERATWRTTTVRRVGHCELTAEMITPDV